MAGCSLETIDTFSASKRSAKKLPIEISVSAGTLDQEPFYIFKNSKGKTIKNLKINPKKTYVFSREKMAESHPFYISDKGFNQESSKAIKIQGDGQYDGGITGQESFELSFPKKYRSDFKNSGTLSFYCTSHSSMFGDFKIKSSDVKSSDPKPVKESNGKNNSPSGESATQDSVSTPTDGGAYGGYTYRSMDDLSSAAIVDIDSTVA
ncbi:MAG: hypothetical protein VX069_01115 [Cyanobacteriota bacterium]|nr:hypothetical protein [Cyanobacteriota bacterium]